MKVVTDLPRFYSDEEIEHLCRFECNTSQKRINLRRKLRKNNKLLAEFMIEHVTKEINRAKKVDGLKERDCSALYNLKSRLVNNYV